MTVSVVHVGYDEAAAGMVLTLGHPVAWSLCAALTTLAMATLMVARARSR